jgi:hypothetical protein
MISWPIARATFKERGLRGITFVCAGIIAVFGCFGGTLWGAEAFTGPISELWIFLLTLSLGGGLLADEVDSGHAQLVLLRPITRAQWVSGRLMGASLVLCLALTIGFLPGFVLAIARGDGSPARLLMLPLGILPQLAWLATLAALSAVLRTWLNAGAVLMARFVWAIVYFGLPLKFPDARPYVSAADPYVFPQRALELAKQLHFGEKAIFSPALWDVFWFCAAWTVAVILFEQRELARRRA